MGISTSKRVLYSEAPSQSIENSLWYKYMQITKGVEYIEEGNMFITYKYVNGTLEIHDVYSEDGMEALIKMTTSLVNEIKPLFIEGYVDKEYEHRDRSDYMLRKFGMKPFKETEDYIYYIKKVDYGKQG